MYICKIKYLTVHDQFCSIEYCGEVCNVVFYQFRWFYDAESGVAVVRGGGVWNTSTIISVSVLMALIGVAALLFLGKCFMCVVSVLQIYSLAPICSTLALDHLAFIRPPMAWTVEAKNFVCTSFTQWTLTMNSPGIFTMSAHHEPYES